ncbi:MAG: hypothetical protein NC253_15970 [Ruminococcus sp.]|nr:hypothetical protein [Ruminococcus sp.]
MKQCPTCGSKYPDDFNTCNACDVPLIEHQIAKEIHYYGIQNKKLQKKYPKECQIVAEARKKVEERRQNTLNSVSVTISQSAMPTQPKPNSIQPEQNIPKCPTCGSTNVNKISYGKKAIGFLAVGVYRK